MPEVGADGDRTTTFRLQRTHFVRQGDPATKLLDFAEVASGDVPLQTASNAMLAAARLDRVAKADPERVVLARVSGCSRRWFAVCGEYARKLSG